MPLTKALVDVPITMCCINWILVLEKIEFGLHAVSNLMHSRNQRIGGRWTDIKLLSRF